MKKVTKRWLFVVLLSAILIFVSSQICATWYAQSNNSLYHNGNWNSAKMELKKGVIGAISFFVTKVTLAYDFLDLGAWHGFQELFYKTKVNPQEIEFDFWPHTGSHFSFIFNKTDKNFCGIQISADKEYKHLYFTANNNRKFLTKKDLKVKNIKANNWNHFKISFANNNFSLSINKVEIATTFAKLAKTQSIGFRGSIGKTLIDNIQIKEHSGNIIKESFTSPKSSAKVILFFALGILGLNLVIFWFARKNKFAAFIVLISNIFLWLLVLCGYAYYLNIGSAKYPSRRAKINWYHFKSNIEQKDAILQKIQKTYNFGDSKKYRILFVGSSQTWGAGASTEDKTYAARIQKMLKTDTYQCINTGISGSRSHKLLAYYKNSWIKLKPKLVIIDLSNNDKKADKFLRSLTEFVELNKKHGIKTMFILEPNVKSPIRLLRNHGILRQIAQKYKIPVVDMHKYLFQKRNDGFLWWDIVHLTDLGQELFAHKLYEEILKVVGK